VRTRRILPWVLYAVCALAVLEGLGYAGYKALELQKQRRDDEIAQHALWHMDSALASVLAAESARPYFHYRPFHPAERAYSAMLGPIEPGEVLVPSPLLTEVPPFVRLHFEIDAHGVVTSPQAPDGNLRDLAEAEYVAADDVITAEALRLMLAELVSASDDAVQAEAMDFSRPERTAQDERLFQLPSQPIPALQQRQAPANERAFQPTQVVLGPLEASWLAGNELVLMRDVRVGETRFRQGVWLDWPSLRTWLLERVRDIAPSADLTPTVGQERSLAIIPASLAFTPAGSVVREIDSPLGVILVLTWLAALLAIVAIGVVLRLATSLAERRGRFVSAVTHELRTPMTSVRLYAELLGSDAARDEARRSRFIEMLQQESARLARIIENVLLYARLGRRDVTPQGHRPSIEHVIDRVAQDQRGVLGRASMSFVQHLDEDVSKHELGVEEEAAARIIGNLIENACKYASEGPDPRVELSVRIHGRTVHFTVRDWGPGVPPRERRRIFDAFHRAARDENHKDGLGLGLALAKGLAKQVGGDLTLDHVDEGASFTVVLPLANEP